MKKEVTKRKEVPEKNFDLCSGDSTFFFLNLKNSVKKKIYGVNLYKIETSIISQNTH